MNDSPIVSAVDVRRIFGEGAAAVRALDGVSVDFPAGRFAAIMGPSGSGKSTLMHILAGLDRPTFGAVTIDGVDLSGLDDGDLTELRRDNVGFVFQFFNLLPVLSAEENILLPLKLAGRDPDPERRAALVAAVGLGDRLSHRPAQLSGGEQQRVAIARALVVDPEILIADEPTGNLDTETGRDIADLIFRSVAERGTTLVLVTHDAELAARCDRTVRIASGQIEAPAALQRRSAAR